MISSPARSGWDTASLAAGLGGRSALAWRGRGAVPRYLVPLTMALVLSGRVGGD
jgi:hypothetical protein